MLHRDPRGGQAMVLVLNYAQKGQHHDHENDHHDDGDYAVGVHATSPEICRAFVPRICVREAAVAAVWRRSPE